MLTWLEWATLKVKNLTLRYKILKNKSIGCVKNGKPQLPETSTMEVMLILSLISKKKSCPKYPMTALMLLSSIFSALTKCLSQEV